MSGSDLVLRGRAGLRSTPQLSNLVGTTLNEMSMRSAAGQTPAESPRLGVDLVDIDVMALQLNGRLGNAFKKRLFTDAEIVDCRDRAAKFATRWAVKEAVSKAIGTGFRDGLTPRAIEIITAADGSIRVSPAAGQAWPHDSGSWRWSVSAAHEDNMAIAVAIALA